LFLDPSPLQSQVILAFLPQRIFKNPPQSASPQTRHSQLPTFPSNIKSRIRHQEYPETFLPVFFLPRERPSRCGLFLRHALSSFVCVNPTRVTIFSNLPSCVLTPPSLIVDVVSGSSLSLLTGLLLRADFHAASPLVCGRSARVDLFPPPRSCPFS